MAAIYLRHPVHGTKVACSEGEAAYDKTHGWREYDPNEGKVKADPAPSLALEPEPATLPEPEAAAPLPARRKRKLVSE